MVLDAGAPRSRNDDLKSETQAPEDMSSRRLIENILSLSALQAANYALPLLMLPYLARVLGVEKLGLMAFSIAIMQVFTVLTDYGFNLSASREASILRDAPDKLSRLFVSVSTLRMAFMLAGFVLLAALVQAIPRLGDDAALYLASYVLVVGNALFPLWLFQGLEQLKLASLVQIASKLVTLIAVFVLVNTPEDVIMAVFLQGAGNLLAALIIMFWIPRALGHAKLGIPKYSELKEQIIQGWHVFISTAAINIYTNSNTLILGIITNPAMVGLYHVAEKIVRAVQFIFNPISQAVYPHVSKLAQDSPEAALTFNRRLMRWAGALALLASITLFLLAPWGIELLFGEDYSQATPILQIMTPLPFLIVISNILGIQTMLAFGLKKSFSRILISASLLNLGLFIPLAKLYQAHGAALANVIVEIVVTLSMLAVLHKHNLNPLTTRQGAISRQGIQ